MTLSLAQQMPPGARPPSIARSHRASKDARLSTGYRDEAIQEFVGRPAFPWIAHMGVWPVKSCGCDGVAPFGAWLSILGSSPFARSGAFAGSTSHTVAALACDCTLIPLSAAKAREARPFFASAFESQAIHRSPTGSAEADQAPADGGEGKLRLAPSIRRKVS